MTDLSVEIAGIKLKNPIIAASGTFGFGEEYRKFFDISKLGGIALKALTPQPKDGNLPPRIAETPSGILNSVGLQNPGADIFLTEQYPRIKDLDTVLIANIAGAEEKDYIDVAEKLNDTFVALYELNVSCPNVRHGGMSFGTDAAVLENLVAKVKKVSQKPLIVKLTPNVTDIVELAKAAVRGGADGLSLINTLTGLAIDVNTRRPIMANNTGGLSGPAVKPVALRMVNQVFRAELGIPIIGMGGIMNGKDAAEFMICGAHAVMVGTATLQNPYACINILEELKEFAEEEGIEKITELTGTLQLN